MGLAESNWYPEEEGRRKRRNFLLPLYNHDCITPGTVATIMQSLGALNHILRMAEDKDFKKQQLIY